MAPTRQTTKYYLLMFAKITKPQSCPQDHLSRNLRNKKKRLLLDVKHKVATWWRSLLFKRTETQALNWVWWAVKGKSHPFKELIFYICTSGQLSKYFLTSLYLFLTSLNLRCKYCHLICVLIYSRSTAVLFWCTLPLVHVMIVTVRPQCQCLHIKKYSTMGEIAPSHQHSCPNWP